MEPTTLQEAILYFDSPDHCREYIVARRWPDGVTCPRCGSKAVLYQPKYNRWQCGSRHKNRQFTLKTGTIFEESPISLDKWLLATWMLANCRNGVSSWEVHRDCKVSQKTAWFMLHRIRMAFHNVEADKLSGHVEADETFIGGKARNMHAWKRKLRITGTGGKDKTVVMGMLERGGQVRTTVVGGRKKKEIQAEVRKHVEAGAALYTDALKSYEGLNEFEHQVIDHAVKYVDGQVHTNGMENYWSLFKRGLNGTYVSVEPFHLFRYLDEQGFRYNHRKLTDAERFSHAVSGIVGKRLTFDDLTGNAEWKM